MFTTFLLYLGVSMRARFRVLLESSYGGLLSKKNSLTRRRRLVSDINFSVLRLQGREIQRIVVSDALFFFLVFVWHRRSYRWCRGLVGSHTWTQGGFPLRQLAACSRGPGQNLTRNREKKNATMVSTGFSIAFLEDGDNNGLFEVFRNFPATFSG